MMSMINSSATKPFRELLDPSVPLLWTSRCESQNYTGVSNAFDRNHLQDLLEEKALDRIKWTYVGFAESVRKWRELRPAGSSHITLNRFSLKRSNAWDAL